MRIASPANVTDAVRQRFREHGFLAIDRLVDAAVVTELRRAYDDIIGGVVKARGDRQLGGVIRQVKQPSKDHPYFRANPALDAGLRLAQSLFLQERMEHVYDMLIDKPAGTEHQTPWHQDVGYYGKPVAPKGSSADLDDLQVWLALDPVDVENGGMQFVPRGRQEPSFGHEVVSGDPNDESRLIGISEPFDTSGAVAHALEPGGCTVHLVGTPHYTGPNLTQRPRRAYIFNIGPVGLAAAAEQAFEAWGDSARL